MDEDLEKTALMAYAIHTVPQVILAEFARYSLIAVAVLLALDLLFGLPFTALWGFILVPIGALVSIVTGYLIHSK